MLGRTTPVEIGRRRRTAAATSAVLAALLFVLTACTSTSPAGTGGTVGGASDSNNAEQKAALDKGYAGDFMPPPTSGPKAVKGKKVWFISCGQLFVACQVMSNSFKDAGAALGWNVTIQDGKADPTVAASLLRQAVAAHVDGVALNSFDCPGIKSALLDAKAAKIPVVNWVSTDCNDPAYGGSDAALFTATVKVRGSDRPLDFYNAWSQARAAYLVAKAGPKAKILWVSEQGQLEQKQQGGIFEKEISTQCPGCKLTRVPFTFAQVPNPATQQFTTALQAHPEANVIAEGIDAMMTLGLQTAVQQSGRKGLIVGGGEGFPANFDLIRSGVQTFSIAIPYNWITWGLADTLNRVFAGANPKTFPDEGAGWQFVDADHNLPSAGKFYEPPVDYKAAYNKIWNG